MNADRLLAHFDRIADAPDAIPRLRAFVLDLAVRGKLVKQASNEARSTLADQSVIESARGSGSSLHVLPDSWAWTSLEAVSSQITDGEHATPTRISDMQVPLVTAKNVRDGYMDYSDTDWVSFQTAGKSHQRCQPRVNDILLVCVGATTGRLCVLREPKNMVLVRSVALIRPREHVNVDYLALAMRSPTCQKQIWSQVKVTAQPCLYLNRIRSLCIPLPPFAEQGRIVDRVNELMALCDRLEAAQAERESRRDRLASASLHRLNNASDASTFGDHARFYLSHLPRLAIRSEHIQELRQTILSFAFRGQLVAQNAAEGTGQDVLNLLSKAHPAGRVFGSTRRNGSPPVDPLRCPALFPIPKSWRWTYLDYVCERIADVDHNMPKAVTNGIPFISAKDLKDDGTIDFSSPKLISEADYQRLSRKVQIRRDDIIYSRIGARLGKARLVAVDSRFIISYSCCLVRPLMEIVDKHYLQQFLDSRLALEQAHRGTQSIGVPDLGLGEIKEFRIPIPPLAEQQRIVAKVSELMAICDRLETQVAVTQSESRRFLESVLREALRTTESHNGA